MQFRENTINPLQKPWWIMILLMKKKIDNAAKTFVDPEKS